MKAWKNKEKNDAEAFKGRRQRGSGNHWKWPGDVKSEKFLIENKQTEKGSYSITLKTWDKLYEQALFSYRIPILSLLIQSTEFVVMSKEDFLKLI